VYVLSDNSLLGSPKAWSTEVIAAYNRNRADRVVGEMNYGGDMVEHTIRTAPDGENISYKNVSASRGKAIRAEPIAALYEQGKAHHVGTFSELEDEMCSWLPGVGMSSPNRMDAMVWAITELLDGETAMTIEEIPDEFAYPRG
jgi:phage terminase large subunit-like protein